MLPAGQRKTKHLHIYVLANHTLMWENGRFP